ncbi:MAG: DUF4330 family protein [Clostridia bacterium]|nr:DUF4330 family protein [Clostridia bacterium]
MRQTQKKENKFPVFDLVLILVIALAVAGGVFWVVSRQNIRKTEIVYTVRFSNVSNEYGGRLAEGKTLYLITGEPAGVISDTTVTRSTVRTFDGASSADADVSYTYTETKSDEFSDILATVRVTADEKTGGFFVGAQRIAGGVRVRMMTGGFASEGEILTVLKEEKAS